MTGATCVLQSRIKISSRKYFEPVPDGGLDQGDELSGALGEGVEGLAREGVGRGLKAEL